MVSIEAAYRILLIFSVVFLAVTICFCLLRAILGPRLADRIVAINIIGCKIIILFSVLGIFLGEHYLLDVSITYSLISFLAVVVLSKVFLSAYNNKEYQERLEGRHAKAAKGEEERV